MKTIEEKIEIYRAYLNGEQIQWQSKSGRKDWEDIKAPSFNYEECDYRVKPEPEKNDIAKAYMHEDGSLCWMVKDTNFLGHEYYTRAPEFDIIANESNE